MAIKYNPRVVTVDGKIELSTEEFKRWLKKLDTNKGCEIHVTVLREAIRATGGWFCRLKADRIAKAIDTNSNGIIDDDEIDKLVMFAQTQFGLKIVNY